jgi:hypothetical protein
MAARGVLFEGFYPAFPTFSLIFATVLAAKAKPFVNVCDAIVRQRGFPCLLRLTKNPLTWPRFGGAVCVWRFPNH